MASPPVPTITPTTGFATRRAPSRRETRQRELDRVYQRTLRAGWIATMSRVPHGSSNAVNSRPTVARFPNLSEGRVEIPRSRRIHSLRLRIHGEAFYVRLKFGNTKTGRRAKSEVRRQASFGKSAPIRVRPRTLARHRAWGPADEPRIVFPLYRHLRWRKPLCVSAASHSSIR